MTNTWGVTNRDRRDDPKGRLSRDHQADHTINTVKPGAKRDYEGAYSKLLSGPCPAHPDSDHTMGTYRGLKAIYWSDPRKKMRGCGKDDKRSNQLNDKKDDEEDKDNDDHDKNLRHYKSPDRTVRTIFGSKVALEIGRDRKLTAWAVMVVANSDDKVANPKYPAWSHREIMFSRVDQWAKIPEPGRFTLVLDPGIGNVRFEKVLINGGSALDILFRNALTDLGIKLEDLL